VNGLVLPQRVQRQRTQGWRMPADVVYVGRPTRWANPFTWTSIDCSAPANGRAFAVDAYRRWLVDGEYGDTVSDTAGRWYTRSRVLADLHLLAGRPLCCWCPPVAPCHADTLLELANNPRGI
jgi:hypothetical protein